MTMAKLSMLFLTCVLCLGAASGAVAQDQSITSQKKAELERKALQGSGDAALEVALFHGTRDEKLMEYWSWIGAENGDPTCQFNYASLLSGKADSYSQIRAIYWMKKAAAQDVEFAKERLKEMLVKEKKKQ